MDIDLHIAHLLYRHDCVIIPGLGALVSRRLPARLDVENHTIYPPTKHVGFNPAIAESDGLLINYVAQVEGIQFEEAKYAVDQHVAVLKDAIHSKGYVNINKVGQLKQAEEDALVFTAINVVNYLPEAFGLTMQSAELVESNNQNNGSAHTPEPAVVAHPASTSPSKSKWWQYAAAAVLLFVAGGIGFKSYEDQSQQQDARIAVQAAQQLEDRLQESTFNITAPLPAITIEVAPLVKTHHIVAGAFRDPANADKRVEQLKRKGFDAKRIGVNSYGLHNVAFSSYVERNDAINELYRLRKLGYQSAWLFTGTLSE